MGTWALDFNTGLGAGSVSRLVNFAGNFFGFCLNTNAAGVWRRVGAGNWVRTIGPGAPGNYGRGEVWHGYMWWVQWDGANYSVYRSVDGINWSFDGTPAVGGASWPAMGGYGSHLQLARIGGIGVEFARRTWTGGWTMYPPATDLTAGVPTGIMSFGSRVHLSTATGSYTWNGTAWSVDSPTSLALNYFMAWGPAIGNDSLWSTTLGGGTYHRFSSGDWRLDAAAPYNGSLGFSLDDDDNLCIGNSTFSLVYSRIGGHWHQQGTPAGTTIYSGCRDGNGVLFAGSITGGSTSFYIYTPNFNVAPGGFPPQAVDVDGDGDSIYVALYNAAGQPLLVKASAPLTWDALGNAVFNPLAGDAISVRCTDVGGELTISGRFAAVNDQVRISLDGGTTWSQIDPGTWGGETAQPLEIDPLTTNEAMVVRQTVPDIIETLDGGTTWTAGVAIPYSAGAMAKMINGDELIIGDDAACRIDYSPNRGVSQANITGAYGPGGGNVAALAIA
jgi:hypothetical protein